MTATGIKNRLGRLEEISGIGKPRFVVIGLRETDEAAYARAGVQLGEDVHVLRVRLVAPTPAVEPQI